MIKIYRQIVLVEKTSGNYGCPHYISPKIAEEIASSFSLTLDLEAQKTIAEIAENFAIELLKACEKTKPSSDDIKQTFSEIVFE